MVYMDLPEFQDARTEKRRMGCKIDLPEYFGHKG